MKFEVLFYEDANGNSQMLELMSHIDEKMRAKLVSLMEILEEKGIYLREPYTKHLEDGIFELRCKLGNNIIRTLYFFCAGGKIIFTNGFIKKTNKTPRSMILIAKKCRAEYVSRLEKSR